MNPKGINILDGKIDEIIEFITEGKTFRDIASHYKIALGTLHRFLTLDEHSARATAALKLSADSYADKAEQILLEAEGTKEELMRARELAQHYRWKSGKRNPKAYGDRVEIEGKMQVETVTGMKID